MNNNLEELSKPVAWFTDDYLTDSSATTYNPEMAQRWREKPWFVGNLYSHEFVSALLAELEISRAIAAEYRDLMYHMDAGGDFYEFQRDKVMKEQSNG